MRYVSVLNRLAQASSKHSRAFGQVLRDMPWLCESSDYSRSYADRAQTAAVPPQEHPESNPLWDYFQAIQEGPGILKWQHYFDIYHRHLKRFIGQKVDVVEVGVYSGGSLGMWRSYFGDQSHIYGVDIEEACKVYANDHVSISIGDQSDRSFWNQFKQSVDGVDILIDDGGHEADQQKVTLEETLPWIRPGGVYICEDIHGRTNSFAAYAAALVAELNHAAWTHAPWTKESKYGLQYEIQNSPFQTAVHSIHFYPFVVVIEKHAAPFKTLRSIKHGTEWQPFFDENRIPAPKS